MCDFSEKLIAWLDGELSQEEAARIKQHLPGCEECAANVGRYCNASRAFKACCDTVWAAQLQRKRRRWAPVLTGAIAAATALALMLLTHSRSRTAPPALPSRLAAAPAITARQAALPIGGQAVPASIVRVNRRQGRPEPRVPANPTAQFQDANWQRAEHSIRIAIPVDAVLPPGAAPEGMAFVGDVRFAADGTPQALVLQPELVSFERRTNQP
jgi:anti-sigma factor RsiW